MQETSKFKHIGKKIDEQVTILSSKITEQKMA
jgi:hypothetical protein